MNFSILGSGSTGNAILVRGEQSLLLDCGFSAREMQRRLDAAGFAGGDLAGILLTHEHADHARGAPRLAAELEIPILGTAGTLAALPEGPYERRAIALNASTRFAGLDLHLFPVEHDAREPAGVRLSNGNGSLGLLTDAGRVTPSLVEALRGCHTLLVESNHDPDLLRSGPYPAPLKHRIAGGHGHLSNDACGQLLQRVITPDTRRVILHHLSRFNNTPELALATNHAILERSHQVPAELLAAPRDGPFGPFPL